MRSSEIKWIRTQTRRKLYVTNGKWGGGLETGNLGIPVLLVKTKAAAAGDVAGCWRQSSNGKKGVLSFYVGTLLSSFSVVHQRASRCISVPPLLLTLDLSLCSSFFVSLSLSVSGSHSHLPP